MQVQARGSMNVNASYSARGTTTAAAPKQSFGQKLGNFAKGVAEVGLNVVGAAVPGGNILAKGLSAALGTGGGNFGGTPGLDGGDMVAKMAQMNMQFLALQEATQMETRKFNTLSNASKARHESAMSSIRNMK